MSFNAGAVFLMYLALMSLVGFAVCFGDKRRSIKGQWRYSEKRLFIIALLGGALGFFAGMRAFRHKTRHWYFVLFMPLIALLQWGAGVYWLLMQ